MKVLFTGLPYFGKKLVNELNEFDPENRYLFCDTYYSKRDKLKFLLNLPSSHLVVSFNGATSRSRALDWTLRFRKKLVMFWHGSDVLTAKNNVAQKNFVSKYVSHAASYSDAKWLIEELKEFNIDAKFLQFKFVEVRNDCDEFKSKDVFTYIAQGKETFYGYDSILFLAEKFPNINFHIAGSTGENVTTLENIKFYGWLSESAFSEMLNTHAIFLRIATHDGYSLSVLKAVANGNYVIWNYPHDVAIKADSNDQLAACLNEFLQKENLFSRNEKGIIWAKENLNRENVLSNFIQTLKTCLDRE